LVVIIEVLRHIFQDERDRKKPTEQQSKLWTLDTETIKVNKKLPVDQTFTALLQTRF